MKSRGRNLKPKTANPEFFFSSGIVVKRKETINFLPFANIRRSPLAGANLLKNCQTELSVNWVSGLCTPYDVTTFRLYSSAPCLYNDDL
jgi:hypothetical protein